MTDSLFYNPFLRIKEDNLKKLMGTSKPYVVIQRFQWPGQPLQKTFILSAYTNEQEARYHEQELRPNEGKAQNLLDLNQYQKVVQLLKEESGIAMFFAGTLDAKHEKRLQKAYAKAVSAYIYYIRMKKEDHYDVRIFVEYGRLKAEIISGEQRHTALFYDMIK
jgi:N-acetyl-anhydromuramyl-L-alanine amidase AmpD